MDETANSSSLWLYTLKTSNLIDLKSNMPYKYCTLSLVMNMATINCK